MKNEKTSARVAKIAGRWMRIIGLLMEPNPYRVSVKKTDLIQIESDGYMFDLGTVGEALAAMGSLVTQSPDKPKPSPTSPAARKKRGEK